MSRRSRKNKLSKKEKQKRRKEREEMRRFEQAIKAVLVGPERLHELPDAVEVLHEFSRPVLELAEGEPSATELRNALSITANIWNACVHRQLGNDEPWLALRFAMEQQGFNPALIGNLMAHLMGIKISRFPADPRLLGNVRVFYGPDGKHIQLDVRLPEELLGSPAPAEAPVGAAPTEGGDESE